MDGRCPAPRRALVVCLVGALLLPAFAAPGDAVARPDAPREAVSNASARDVVENYTTTVSLDSGGTYWQGWRLRFNASRIVDDPATASVAERTFQIRRVNDHGQVGDLVAEFTVGPGGGARIDTSAFAGRVVIQHEGKPVYVRDGVGYTGSTPGGGRITVANSTWRVERQTLEVSWSDGSGSDSSVYNGQRVHLELASNRESYVVAVSIRGLDFRALTRLFPRSAYAPGFDARADEGVIRLRAGADTAIGVNISGIDPESYAVHVTVEDTTAAKETTLTVERPPPSPQFLDVPVAENVGDVVRLTARCEQCYLVVGDPSDGVLDLVELRDGTGDGRVTVRMNTRYVGLDKTAAGVPGDVAAYAALGGDTVSIYQPGDRVGGDFRLSKVRDDLGLDPTGRTVPLSPRPLTIRLATSDAIVDRPPDVGGELVVPGEADARTIFLTNRSLRSIDPLVAPAGPLGAVTLADLRTAPERRRIAIGDQLILRIDVAGLEGYLTADGVDRGTSALLDNEREGIDLTLRSSVECAVNNRVDLGTSSTRLFVDGEHDTVYVVADTGALRTSRPLTVCDRYRAIVSLTGTDSPRTGYPYLPAGAIEEVNATIGFVQPRATIDDAPPLRVTNHRPIRLTGTTTVAPGTRLTLVATAEEPFPWTKTVRVRVRPNGTWVAPFDFSNARRGQRFTLRIERGGAELARERGFVVNATAPVTRTPPERDVTETATETPPPTEPTSPTATETAVPTTAPPESPATPDTPTATEPAAAPPTEEPEPTPAEGDGAVPFVPNLPGLPGIVAIGVVALLVAILLGGGGYTAVRSFR